MGEIWEIGKEEKKRLEMGQKRGKHVPKTIER